MQKYQISSYLSPRLSPSVEFCRYLESEVLVREAPLCWFCDRDFLAAVAATFLCVLFLLLRVLFSSLC